MIHAAFCLAYLLLAIVLARQENARRKRTGFDSFHLVLFFYGIYVLLASVFIHGILALRPETSTGVYFFDSVYQRLDGLQACTIFLLNILFLIGFYTVRLQYDNRTSKAEHVRCELQIRPRVLAFWLILGFILCGTFFWRLGDNFIERYANLILFRNLDDSSERTAFSANAFSVTQTFSWLCAALIFHYHQQRKWSRFSIILLLTIFFSLLMGSRRGFIFPIIIVYLCFAMARNRTFVQRLLYLAPIAILWISFGKQLTSSIAYDGVTADALDAYTSVDSGLLRAFSDIGIGQVQSFAVLQHFDFTPRYGTDHLLSALRRIPAKEFLGIADYFPERITRITTTLFSSADDADIPPGLMGASWLDFPFIGAIAWGMFLALQAALIEHFRARARAATTVTLLSVLVAVVVAMPINTGSYDFTFSIDIVLLALILVTSIRSRKLSH